MDHMGSMADLPAMKTNPKFIFFTDFDGTITTQDSEPSPVRLRFLPPEITLWDQNGLMFHRYCTFSIHRFHLHAKTWQAMITWSVRNPLRDDRS